MLRLSNRAASSLSDARQARQVFAGVAQAIAQGVRSGEIVALEPKADQLAAVIDALGR